MPALTAASSLRGDQARGLARCVTGKPLKRSVKVAKCWRASSVVGTTTATWKPASAATKAARSATSVLPKPTSPHTSRSMGLPRGEILQHGADAGRLVLGLLVREARDELVERALGRSHHRRLAQLAQRRDLDQLRGDLADALLEARLARLPGDAAQPVELHAALGRAVARQQLDVLDRQIELVAPGVGDLQAIVRRAAR